MTQAGNKLLEKSLFLKLILLPKGMDGTKHDCSKISSLCRTMIVQMFQLSLRI